MWDHASTRMYTYQGSANSQAVESSWHSPIVVLLQRGSDVDRRLEAITKSIKEVRARHPSRTEPWDKPLPRAAFLRLQNTRRWE